MRSVPVVAAVWSQLKELAIYLALILAFVLYADYKSGQLLDSVRREINRAAERQCESGQQTDALGHYNLLVDALIEDYDQRKAENESRKDWEKATINAGTLGKFSLAKIPVRKVNCDRPLLPEGR